MSDDAAFAAGASTANDEAYLELVCFLQDQKLDVQKMAAQGVLSETEDQDFLGFCQRYPRKVAKPLLRLVERAEELSTTAKKAVSVAVESEGNLREQEKVVRQAAMEAATALASGSAALQALVNLSGVPAVRDELVTLSAPRRLTESMRSGWLEGRAGLAHWQSMVLANLTNSEEGQKAVCNDDGHVLFLLSAYVAKPRPPPREGADDPMACLGKVMCNLCAIPEGRRILATTTSLAQLANELSDRSRRLDIVGALRNLCLDEECHGPMVESACMVHCISFLYPLEKVSDEHRNQLPSTLLEELLAEGATLTTESAVRAAAATCLVGLCQTEAGRNHLRAGGFSEVMRAWEMEEDDDSTKAVLKKAMTFLSLSEEEHERELKRLVAPKLEDSADGPRPKIEEITDDAAPAKAA